MTLPQTSQPPPPPPPLPPPPPPPPPSAAAAKSRRDEELLLNAAIDMSLQKPVDPRKLASSKVHTVTMPLLAQPRPDIMHGSRLALLVISTTRHAARHHSHRPSSASDPSPWNRRPHPSQRYVIYASTEHGSQPLSLYVCMQARITRASTEKAPAGRAMRKAQRR